MHLYQGTTQQFIADATQARLANILADRWFDEFRYRPSPFEVTSWRNSLSGMANVLQVADLTDQGRAQYAAQLEAARRPQHRLEPNSKRDSAVIVALQGGGT